MANNSIKIKVSSENFLSECRIIDLNKEYPGYTGTEHWAIITALDEKTLYQKYREIILNFTPYILLPLAYGEERDKFIRNDGKFAKRACIEVPFDFSEDAEEHHTEVAAASSEAAFLERERKAQVCCAVKKLKETQRRCIRLHFFSGLSLRQIAIADNKAYSTIYEAYRTGMLALRKQLRSENGD